MAPERFHPTATRRLYTANGGSYVGDGPPIFIVHTTETRGLPGYGGQTSSKAYAPHFTIDLLRPPHRIWQHTPIDVAARALRNSAGGVQTNRRGRSVVQVELIAYARDAAGFPDSGLKVLGGLIAWTARQTGLLLRAPYTFRGGEAYGLNGAARISQGAWLGASGILGHQHVPENTHWNPGRINIGRVLEHARNALQGDTMSISTRLAIDALWLKHSGLHVQPAGDETAGQRLSRLESEVDSGKRSLSQLDATLAKVYGGVSNAEKAANRAANLHTTPAWVIARGLEPSDEVGPAPTGAGGGVTHAEFAAHDHPVPKTGRPN